MDPNTKADIWLRSVTDRKPRRLVKTPFDEGGAQLSPDRRWVAYQSNQSGGWEVYVQPVSSGGGRLQASQGSGVRPVWQPGGASLTYLHGRDVMRVAFSGADGGELGLPVRLFSLQEDDLFLDVMKDGRFVVLRRGAREPSPTHVITNWFVRLRRDVATVIQGPPERPRGEAPPASNARRTRVRVPAGYRRSQSKST